MGIKFWEKRLKKKKAAGNNLSVLDWGEIHIKTTETQQTGKIKDLKNWSVTEVTVLYLQFSHSTAT